MEKGALLGTALSGKQCLLFFFFLQRKSVVNPDAKNSFFCFSV